MVKHFEKLKKMKEMDGREVVKRGFRKVYASGITSLRGMSRIGRIAMLKLTSSRFALLNSVGEYYKQALLEKANDVETLRDLVLYGNEKNAFTKLKKLSKNVEAMVALAEIYRKKSDNKTISSGVQRFLKGKRVGGIEEGVKATIDEIKKRFQYTLWSAVPGYLISSLIGIPTLLTMVGVAAYSVYKIGELKKNIETLSQLSKATPVKANKKTRA